MPGEPLEELHECRYRHVHKNILLFWVRGGGNIYIYNLYSLLLLEVVMFILQLIIKTEQSLEIHVKISPKLNTTPRLKVCGKEDITYNDIEIIMVSKGHEILKT